MTDPTGVLLGLVPDRRPYCRNAFEEYMSGMCTVQIDGRSIRCETKSAPLWWQERGLSQTASGCGRKLATTLMVRFPFTRRWHRVYVCCFSNNGTAYILRGGVWHIVGD